MRLIRPTYQRVCAVLLGLALAATSAASARADSRTLVVRGAGYGHGVGMSQQGALGFARHGWDYRAILMHYFSGTALSSAPPGQTVRVLVQANRARVSFVGGASANRSRLSGKAMYTVTLARGGRAVTLRHGSRRVLTARLVRIAGSGPLTVGGRSLGGGDGEAYPGRLEIRPALHGGVNVIDVVGLEDYVRGVIANEMPATWPAAALQAQAVASRTFAITADAGPASSFDVYADTRSQVYRGLASRQGAADAAVVATAGQIVTYGGQPAITYFFASSGGRTENVENVFAGSPASPWLRGVDDPYDSGPMHSWGPLRLSFADAAVRLGGLVRGSFAGVEVTRRGYSPRIVDAYVLGSGGATPVTGDELAARLGLPDTWAYFGVLDAGGEHPEPDRSGQPPPGEAAAGGGSQPPASGAPNGGTPAG